MSHSESGSGSGPGPWESPSTALTITKDDTSTEQITGTLGLKPGVNLPIGADPGGENTSRWIYKFDHRYSLDVDRQILALKDLLVPYREKLRELVAAGHAVEVEITGIVETGCTLSLTPAALDALKALAVPVSFTTIPAPGVELEDPLAWLG